MSEPRGPLAGITVVALEQAVSAPMCTRVLADFGAGPIPALLPPPVISGYEPAMGAVPGLGQHTDAVLAELGITEHEIAGLREQGAIGPVYR